MNILPSTTLRNDYGRISALAHETDEPVFVTRNGEGDLVVMSIAAYESLLHRIAERDMLLEAAEDRISGEPTYSLDEVWGMVEEIFDGQES